MYSGGGYSRSPPPLQHPVPTHPAYIPDPPSTPVSPQGYQRFSGSSSPAPPPPPGPGPIPPQHLHQHQPHAYVPAYTSPFQHNPVQVQSVPSQHPVGVPIPQPDFGAWGMNDVTAQFGMQLGHSAVAAGQDYVQRNFGSFLPSNNIKHFFNVSNSYVIRKLRLVLFPWMHKPWSRRVRRNEQGYAEYQPPRDDINSPDLYIPLMALVTYILLSAITAGIGLSNSSKTFHPSILSQAFSRALAVLILDFCFVKLGCYVLNVQAPSYSPINSNIPPNSHSINPNPNSLSHTNPNSIHPPTNQNPTTTQPTNLTSGATDLIAYGGYKFIGVILTLTANFLSIGRTMYALVFLYAFLANAFFLLRSLRAVVLPEVGGGGGGGGGGGFGAGVGGDVGTTPLGPAQRRRRITFLFLEAVCQVVYMGVLVRV